MWEHINKLTGRKQKAGNNTDLYDSEGKKLQKEEGKKGIRQTWREIYKTGRKELTPIYSKKWSRDEIPKTTSEYEQRRELEKNEKGKDWVIGEKPTYTIETLEEGLKNLKPKKAAGPDQLKAEVYHALGKKELCKEVLAESYNNILEEEEIPPSWKKSRTRLIPKVSKPQPKDMRPIAITNISYKLYMSHIGDEIEKHIEANELEKGNQIGFTKGGRTEYNHFVLKYITDKAQRKKEQLIVITLDFKKAFDSIDRNNMIEALKEQMINPYIIDLVAKIYSDDSTVVTYGEIEEEMDINSGVKQGCTASTILFKLVTYMIMKRVENTGERYEVEGLDLSTLLYADDSLTMARRLEAAKKNLRIIIEESKKYGLEINKEKSSVLIFNNRENISEIEGIQVNNNFKYLGIMIDDKRDIFKSQKEDIADRADKSSNRTYSVIKRSCNKMLIGKTYWKGVILPSVLHGVGLMEFTQKEINKLQATENRTYRTILGARQGTPNVCVRGETGASLVKSRLMKARILLAHSIWNGKNKVVREVLRRVRRDRDNTWNKRLNQYLREIGISFEQMVEMSPRRIKKRVDDYDSRKWYEEMTTKTSIGIYRRFKKRIKDERIYDNRRSSELLFRARSNTLALNIENRHRNNNKPTECELCHRGDEDMKHFMLDCWTLEETRDQDLLRKYWRPDKDEMIGEMIFDNTETERVKQMLENMWHKRLVELKKRRQRRQQVLNLYTGD